MRQGRTHVVVVLLAVAGVLAVMGIQSRIQDEVEASEDRSGRAVRGQGVASGSESDVVLAFAGDIHFEGGVASLLDDRDADLGPLSRALRQADLAVVNLETALTNEGTPTRKELEVPSARYWFRAPERALGVLARSGVDVATVANNHGADYGRGGLRDTLRIKRDAPVSLIGAGRNIEEAFAPYETTINGTDVAVIAADASPRESRDALWGATADEPGIASARNAVPARLLGGVRRAAETSDIVVVYLHWGAEGASCATADQVGLAKALSEAGADVVVGAHSHTLLGSGMLGSTYVNYGLGNFLWYHGSQPDTGVLQLRFSDGELVEDSWVPGFIPPDGGPARALRGNAAEAALGRWDGHRDCTSLAPLEESDPEEGTDLPAFTSDVRRIGPASARRMESSYAPGCPVPLSDLRYLRVSYVDFEGRARRGEIVINAQHATDVVSVFKELYDARWPIERMRLVSDYGSDDNRSMAANNSSGYNCRTVAGQLTWSTHAFGAAVDLNPIQNPYLTANGILPPEGEEFADVDRSVGADTAPGVIREGDVVVRAFERIGWIWGGRWSEADYQHFNAP